MANQTFTIPDIGNFDSVEVIEIHVKAGDSVKTDDALITLESEKASMDIPATFDGIVQELLLKVGDKVKQGDSILSYDIIGAKETKPAEKNSSSNPSHRIRDESHRPEQFFRFACDARPCGCA